MSDGLSIHEIRRRAPLGYWMRANNARFSAYVIWSAADEDQTSAAEQTKYGGSPDIALHESFLREASLALELIIKAVIAKRIEMKVTEVLKVRPTHDLRLLWSDAGLPKLPQDDLHRLLMAKRTLMWSGRYAAPLHDKSYSQERSEIDAVSDIVQVGNLKLVRSRSFTWNDVNRIYSIAAVTFAELDQEQYKNVPGLQVTIHL